jgi:parvulin-like peptidyl-prolyl isomerase
MKVKPSHILVKHEYEAKDILRLIENKKKFEDLARKFSLCRSGHNGGFLGEINAQNLDSDFLDAFNSLSPGQISKPVRTSYGWHIIKKEDNV